MKNFVVLATFVAAMVFGMILSNSLDISSQSDAFQCQNRSQRADATPNKPLFTLEESNHLIGKKVISHDPDFKYQKIGRIISIEMVEPDKFLVEIYWGNGVMDENSTVTFHGRDLFSEQFEIFD